MEVTNSKIMIGNKVLKNHGALQLQQLTGKSFSYELQLNSNDPIVSEQNQLAGKNIYIWITALDGQKNFLIGTVRQINSVRHSHDSGETVLSGEVKRLAYVLSLFTNYRVTLTLAVLIPLVFLSILAYLFIDQKQHLVERTGIVTAFSKRSGGARSPATYKFQLKEYKVSFSRPYEGFSRFTALNLRNDIYVTSQGYPYLSKRELKPDDQRRFSWYMEKNDLPKLNTEGVSLPYVYLYAPGQHSNGLFLYDLYTYVFDKYNMFGYLFIAFMPSIAFLLMGVGIKRGNNLIWKIYGGFVMAIFMILFII